jgi:hypothetical protein
MCIKEIGLLVQNMITSLGSIVNIILILIFFGDLYDHANLHFDMNKIFIGAPNIMRKVTTTSNSYAVPFTSAV